MKPQADIQSTYDERGIALGEVGIEGVVLPLPIAPWNPSDGPQLLPCTVRMTVSLAAERRGIHMSRMVQALESQRTPISPETMPDLLRSITA